MLFKYYALVFIPIGLTISNKLIHSNSHKLAHFPTNVSEVNKEKRVSFNEQISYYLKAINRFQQAHYFELARFASSNEELQASGLNLASNRDLYQIIIENKDNVAFSFALPKSDYSTYKIWSGSSWIDAQEPLYSYVTAIAYIKENSNFQSILCVSKVAGKQQLNKPQINNGKFTCSVDTEEIP